MEQLNKHQLGFLTGCFFAAMHGVWILLVLLGFGQAILKWIFWLHFLNDPFTILPFTLTQSFLLLGVTFIVGYALGWISTAAWNVFVAERK